MTDGARSGNAGAGGTSGRRRRRRRRPAGGDGAASEPAAGAKRAAGGSPTDVSGSTRRRKRGGRSRSGAAARSATTGAKVATKGAGGKGAGGKGAGGKRTGAKRAPAAGRRRSKAPTKREVSAGGVVYRRDDGAIEVVLASRRTRRGALAWGLAKGGIENGESMEDAAVREVREETGLRAEIETSLGETRYFYVWEDVRIRKTVHFFLMRHTGGDVDDRDDEMEEVRWFPLERALKRAAYRGEREVLKRAAELLR